MAWMKLNTHRLFRTVYLYKALPSAFERVIAKVTGSGNVLDGD